MKLNASGFEKALAKIGSIKESISIRAESPLQKLVVEIAQTIIDEMKLAGVEGGMSPNSLLLQSISPSIVEGDDSIKITISANDYWDFINSGVDGFVTSAGALPNESGGIYSFKNPFPNKKMAVSLRQGMANKGLSLPPNFKTYEAFSYAAATNIKKHGIKPNGFVDKVLTDEFINKISISLTRELGKEVILKIKST